MYIGTALHIAAACSENSLGRKPVECFKHIVNYDRIHKYNGVNALNGYKAIEIHSPLELVYGDEDEDI